MKEKFLDFCITFLQKNNDYSELELKKLRYGLEGIYLTLTKTIIILLVSVILNIFIETLICILLFNIIRYFAFGFHAEKSFHCLLLSLFNFVAIPYVLLKVNNSLVLNIIICLICLVFILIFAPADTVKRPLKDKKKRMKRKVLTFLTGCLYTLLIVFLKNSFISDILVSTLIITVIVINPITYKIFGQPYNNYKKIN
ncbi:MAG: accessory gene regulator B family protein [Bacilli bacterium]|nr:accessory gene regulator B family protein [Bacilli bacterium]